MNIKISGSRAAAILNLSQYRSQIDVWLEIKESREPGFIKRNGYDWTPFEGNTQTLWGQAFESSVIELTEQAQGQTVYEQQRIYNKDNMSCTIDGLIDIDGESILVEAKTTNIRYYRDNFGEPGTDRIPQGYMIQVQHNMMMSCTESAILPVLVFPRMVTEWEAMGWIPTDIAGEWVIDACTHCINPQSWATVLAEMGYFHIYKIDADPELQALMLEKYEEFWDRHIIGNDVPEPRDYSDIKALCPEPVGTIIADERITRLMAEYKQIGDEISTTGNLGKRREELKVAILNYMRTAGAVEDDESKDKFILRDEQGKKLASWGRTKSGSMVFR
jgi:hypothetical protein